MMLSGILDEKNRSGQVLRPRKTNNYSADVQAAPAVLDGNFQHPQVHQDCVGSLQSALCAARGATEASWTQARTLMKKVQKGHFQMHPTAMDKDEGKHTSNNKSKGSHTEPSTSTHRAGSIVLGDVFIGMCGFGWRNLLRAACSVTRDTPQVPPSGRSPLSSRGHIQTCVQHRWCQLTSRRTKRNQARNSTSAPSSC